MYTRAGPPGARGPRRHPRRARGRDRRAGGRAGRGGRRHRQLGQAHRPDRHHRGACWSRSRSPSWSCAASPVRSPRSAPACGRSTRTACENLSNGLNAVAGGDLTDPGRARSPRRSTSSRPTRSASCRSTFNEMLDKAQSSIESYNEMREQLGVADRRGLGQRRHRVVRLAADGVHLRGGRPRRRRDRLGRQRRRAGRRAPGAHGRDDPRGRAGGRHRGQPQRRHRP